MTRPLARHFAFEFRIMTREAAYSKGKQAFKEDRGPDDSPYSGILRDAWEDGWHDMAAEQKRADESSTGHA